MISLLPLLAPFSLFATPQTECDDSQTQVTSCHLSWQLLTMASCVPQKKIQSPSQGLQDSMWSDSPTPWPHFLLIHSAPTTYSSLGLLENTRCNISSGPLHFLVPLPVIFFLQISMWLPPSLYSVSAQSSPCHCGPCWSLYIKGYPYHFSVWLPYFGFPLCNGHHHLMDFKMSETWMQAISNMVGNGTSGFSILSPWQLRHGPPHL